MKKPIVYTREGDPLLDLPTLSSLLDIPLVSAHSYIYRGVSYYTPSGARKTLRLTPYTTVGRAYLFRAQDVIRFLREAEPALHRPVSTRRLEQFLATHAEPNEG